MMVSRLGIGLVSAVVALACLAPPAAASPWVAAAKARR